MLHDLPCFTSNATVNDDRSDLLLSDLYRRKTIMPMNLNIIAAALGCLALLACLVIYRNSGRRGLILALCGCGLIVSVTLAYTYPTRLLSLAGILFASCVLALLALCISAINHTRRRHGPRYHPPTEMSGICSTCARYGLLKRYQQGWLCATCASRLHAQAA